MDKISIIVIIGDDVSQVKKDHFIASFFTWMVYNKDISKILYIKDFIEGKVVELVQNDVNSVNKVRQLHYLTDLNDETFLNWMNMSKMLFSIYLPLILWKPNASINSLISII